MGWIDRMSIPVLFLWMWAFLLLFALSYWLLGFRRQGLTAGGGWVHFPDCLYFSVVTFTSLGYGDIVPHGVGKILACLEVMLGLAFLGVFIAKLTSSKRVVSPGAALRERRARAVGGFFDDASSPYGRVREHAGTSEAE
jgi:hypothetical protein